MSTELVGRWPAHVQHEESSAAVATAPGHDEAVEFVRFCYRRRRAAWPELYDEMCAVAARGSYRGLGYGELAERGILLCLGELSRLAVLTELVVSEDHQRLDPACDGGVPMMLRPVPAAS